MSAICGVWALHADINAPAVCSTMLETLSRHGPDRRSQYPAFRSSPDNPLAFGHALLQITAEDELEAQPLTSSTPQSLWLVADARIDNRVFLAAALNIPQSELSALPDSAFILRAWQRWGQDCVRHLVGSFAFAVWETSAQQLFLARDHAGDRPLYFHKSSRCFAFATTARALRTCPGVSSDLDQAQLARDLVGLPPEILHSRFRDIQAIAPGYCLLVTRTAVVHRRHWNIFSLPAIRFRRDDDYVQAFLEVFDEAVRCRLRTTGNIATELSAGLDSGSVTATAARLLAATGTPLTSYTSVPCAGFSGLIPPNLIADEGPFAAEVAALYPNITHHRVDATASDMLRELARIFPLLDLPHAAPLNSVWINLIHDRAAAAGVKVMLAGSLGNFTVSYSGSDILHNTFRSGRWLATLRLASHLRKIGLSSGRNAASLTLFAMLPWALRRRIDPLIRQIGLEWSPLLPDRIAEFNTVDHYRRYLFERHSPLPLLMETQFQRNQYGDYNAATGAGWGIETRDPTADKRVFEFCAAIPPEQFFIGGQGRSLILRAMRGRLPQSTLTRTAKGTQAADWYESLGKIHADLLAELALLQQSPEVRHLVDLDLIRGALEDWPATARNAAQQSGLYQSAIPRGVSVGYFIRRTEAEARPGAC